MKILGFVSTVAIIGLSFILVLAGDMRGMSGWILLLLPLIVLGSLKILVLFMIPAYTILFFLTKKRFIYGLIWAGASLYVTYYYFAHSDVSSQGRHIIVSAIVFSISIIIIMHDAVAARNEINLDRNQTADISLEQ